MRQIFKDRKPAFFDMVPEKSLVQKGQKWVTIITSGSEKRHVTVILIVAADGFILPPMIIFRGKTNQIIKDIEAPEGLGRVAWWLATCARKPKVPVSNPAASYVQR